MNGEICELCALTANARCALKSGAMSHTTQGYINSERFVFLPRKIKVIEDSAEKWFVQLKRLGVADIRMLLPLTAKNRERSGFINTNGGCILCFFDSGEVTYFTSEWRFNKEKRSWNIEFTEYEWENPPQEKPRFSDNTAEFTSALSDIAELAEKIDEKFWADIFREALGILNGSRECENTDLPNLPERNLRLYCAAAKSDVFGAMGSWNDSPPYSAKEKGLADEYRRFSDELFIQIRKALLFAVNEI